MPKNRGAYAAPLGTSHLVPREVQAGFQQCQKTLNELPRFGVDGPLRTLLY